METMEDFAGLMRERPVMAFCMTMFALSALGLPPLGEFWGKFYVFRAAWGVGPGLGASAVIALVGSVVAAFFYLRLVKAMWLDPSPGPTDTPAAESRAVAYVMAVIAFPVVLIALTALDPLAHAAAAALASVRGANLIPIPPRPHRRLRRNRFHQRRGPAPGRGGRHGAGLVHRGAPDRGARPARPGLGDGRGQSCRHLSLRDEYPPARAAQVSFVAALAVADLARAFAPRPWSASNGRTTP